MSSIQFNQSAYGLTQPTINIFPAPISALRAPLTSDLAQIGTVWVYRTTNTAYILTSIVGNSANWESVTGGAGVFSSLTVTPGPINLTGAFTLVSGTNAAHIADDAADHATTIGSTTGSSAMVIQGGTGGILLSPATTGVIFLGNATTTGNIQVGNSTAGQAIFIASAANTGAQSVNIATGASGANSAVNILTGTATAGSQTFTLGSATMTGAIILGQSTAAAGQTISIGNAANAGAQVINIANGASGANSTVNILSGNGTAGTQTLNIMGGTRAGAVNISTGLAATQTTIGNSTGAASVTIIGGTGGITLAGPFVLLPGAVHIYTGAGVPANGLALSTGDLYINTTAATAATRLYIATNAGAWTFFTANA